MLTQWQTAINDADNLTPEQLSEVNQLSPEEVITSAQWFIDKFYANQLQTVDQFIDYINSKQETSSDLVKLVARTLKTYKKKGRLSEGFTTILCQALRLNSLLLIEWLIGLRVHLSSFAAVVDVINEEVVTLATARHIIFNTAFVSRMIVIEPNYAKNIKTVSPLKTTLLNCHPLISLPPVHDTLDPTGLVALAKNQQWNVLDEVLDSLSQEQRSLLPEVAVNLLAQIAESCPDDKAVNFFEKLQKVAALYWPNENNPLMAAIKANKHQLMLTMTGYATSHPKNLYHLVYHDDAVTVETLTVLLQSRFGFYMHILDKKIDEECSALLSQKYQALTTAFENMPRNSIWQARVLEAVTHGYAGWIKKFPEVFTKTSLNEWASQGHIVTPMAHALLMINVANAEELISELFKNPESQITAAGMFNKEVSYAKIAMYVFMRSLLQITEQDSQYAFLSLMLNRMQQFSASKQITTRLIAKGIFIHRDDGKFKGLTMLAALLFVNHSSIALRLCKEFGLDEDVNDYACEATYKDMSPLVVALRKDEVTLDTFSAWLTAPKLSLEVPRVHLQGLTALGEEKLSVWRRAKCNLIKKQLAEQSPDYWSTRKNQENFQDALSYMFAGDKKWNDVFDEEVLSLLLNKQMFSSLWGIINAFNEEQRIRILAAIPLNNKISHTYNEKLKVQHFCRLTRDLSKNDAGTSFLHDWYDLDTRYPLILEEILNKINQNEELVHSENLAMCKNMLAFIDGVAPATLAKKLPSLDAPLLSESEQRALDGAFKFVRDQQLAPENFKMAKYQSFASLLARADLYPNEETISSIQKREDIAIESVKITAWNLGDKDIVHTRLEQLIALLNQKVMVISAPRTHSKTEGAESEKLIKQIIVTLAFRKLYLMLAEKNNLPANGFDLQAQRPNYKNLQRIINVDSDVLEALNMCHQIVSQYSGELGLSVFGGGEAKSLSDLIQNLKKRSEQMTTNSSSRIPYASPRIGLECTENL